MGDDSPLKPVKRRSRDSLEFVGAPRRSLFGQYNNRSASANATSVQLYSSTPPDSDIQASAQAKPIYQAPVRIDRTGLEGLNNQDIAELTEDVVSQDLNDLLDEDADDGSILRDIPTSHIKRSKTKKPRLDAQGNLVPVEPRHKKLRLIFGLVGIIVGVAVIISSLIFLSRNGSAIPANLRESAGFPVYEMVNNKRFYIDKKSVATGNNKSITFVTYERDNGARFVVSQQSIPDIVKSADQYQKFLTDTDKFASVDSVIGKAYFTRPASIGDDISVVVKTDTTLLFIRGPGVTNEQTWVTLLSYFKVVK